jgi:hypothetical protein
MSVGRGGIVERISKRFRDRGERGALRERAIARHGGAVHGAECEGEHKLALTAEIQLAGERDVAVFGRIEPPDRQPAIAHDISPTIIHCHKAAGGHCEIRVGPERQSVDIVRRDQPRPFVGDHAVSGVIEAGPGQMRCEQRIDVERLQERGIADELRPQQQTRGVRFGDDVLQHLVVLSNRLARDPHGCRLRF